MFYRISTLVLAASLLSACASDSSTSSQPTNASSAPSKAPASSPTQRFTRCSSSAVEHLINREGNQALLEQAQQQAGAERVRMVRQGAPMTMDYDSQRLNLYLDAQGRVSQATCG